MLRKELVNNRFLLLLKLKAIDVHPTYPLQKLNYSSVTVKALPEAIAIDLTISHHPDPGQYNASCYDCELLLFTWDNTDTKPMFETQLSPWLRMNEPVKKIKFEFEKRTCITQWVLFLRIRLGVKHEVLGEQYVEAKVAEGMGIVEVGSFDEKDLALLRERNDALGKREPERRKADVRERKGVVSD